jgi:hypothetical protein
MSISVELMGDARNALCETRHEEPTTLSLMVGQNEETASRSK